MFYITIDKRLKLPYYQQIIRSVKTAIESGLIRHNDRLPSDLELAEFFDISSIGPRNAYRELEQEGYVKRIKGKGTFALARPVFTLPLKRFYDHAHYSKQGHDPLLRTVHSVNAYAEDGLELRTILRVKRYPTMHQWTQFSHTPPAHVFHLIEQSKPWLEVFKAWFDEPLTVKTRVFSMRASSLDALILELEEHEPLMVLYTDIETPTQGVVAKIRAYFPAQYTRLEVGA